MSGLPLPAHRGEEVGDTVREVLSRPEYQPPPRGLMERVLDWVFEQLGRFFDTLGGGGGGSLLAWAVVGGIALVVILVAARVGRTIGPRARTAGEGAMVPSGVSAAEWMSRAAADEAARRWASAVRNCWRALVAGLVERGLLDEMPGTTAGEYRLQVSRHVPDAAADFSAATDIFESVFYGHLSAGPDEVARLRSHGEGVVGVVGGRRAQAPSQGVGA